jgi:Plasmid pRiA4b ORF-3-like protein
MPTPSCCDRLTIRVVLLKVSPLVARLISVPDDLSLEELHDVLQLVLGWSGQAFYNFRIHGQEIGRRRHLRTHLLREFQLRRREKFLYTYDFLDLWEWEIRVLDIEPGRAEAWRPRCLAGRAATPPEECGGPRGYMRILDQRKYYPPMAEQELVEKALQRIAGVLPDLGHRDLLKELLVQGLEKAVQRLKEYAQFQPDRFSLQEVNDRLVRFCPYGRAS